MSVRADLQVFGYQDRLHDPFYVGADKAFIGASYNWSGYGRVEDPLGTGIELEECRDDLRQLLPHRQSLQADPRRRPGGAAPKVRFYRTTDPNGEYWESEIAVEAGAYKGTQVASSDLWVGKLAQTPPSWVMRYPLAQAPRSDELSLVYRTTTCSSSARIRPAARRACASAAMKSRPVNSYGTYQWDYNPAAGFGADEAQTQTGDSGSPSFFIAGAHSRACGSSYARELRHGSLRRVWTQIASRGRRADLGLDGHVGRRERRFSRQHD